MTEFVNLIQGTPEWDAFRENHYPASEAPSVMGVSKFDPMTPEDLALVRLGLKDVEPSDYVQEHIFDKGHRMEDCARPLVEKIIGEELANTIARVEVDGLALPMSASYDGLTFFGEVIFEHKMWNEKLAEDVRNNNLSPAYYWQLEQQLHVVSTAKKVIFVTSDAFRITEDEYDEVKGRAKYISDLQIDPETGERFYTAAHDLEYCEYTPVQGRIEQLIESWKAFEEIVGQVLIDDESWYQNVEGYLAYEAQIKSLEAQVKKLKSKQEHFKSKLINGTKNSGSKKVLCGGVQISQTVRKGGVDEDKLKERLSEDEVNKCRKTDSVYWTVRATKDSISEQDLKLAKERQEKMGNKIKPVESVPVPSPYVVNAGLFSF